MGKLVIFAAILSAPVLAKTYTVDGIVVAVDPAARTMLVSHRAIATLHASDADAVPGRKCRRIGSVAPGLAYRVRACGDQGQVGRPEHPANRRAGCRAIRRPRKSYPSVRRCRTLRSPTNRDAHCGPPIFAGKSWPSTSSTRGVRCPMCARGFRQILPCCSASFAIRLGDESGVALGDGGSGVRYSAVLAEYARRWAAGTGWRFLTGDVAKLGGIPGRNLLEPRKARSATIPPPPSSGAMDVWPPRWKARVIARISSCI